MDTRDLARIADRPSPDQWGGDELLTLPEAAALFWPRGPITTSTLRNAVRNRRLRIVELAGKFFTSRTAVEEMCRGGPVPPPLAESPTDPLKRQLLEQLETLKRRRSRRRDQV